MKEIQNRDCVIEKIEKLYEKIFELEKHIENTNEFESIKRLKNKLKYAKNSVKRMEENENINLIRLAEAEKKWLILKKGEVIDRKNFTEELDADQFYKEKFDKVQKEMEEILKEYSKLEAEISNLKIFNESLSKSIEKSQKKIVKINEEGTDVIYENENEMKKAMVQLERKNEELINENSDLITKNHEIISEHKKCNDVLAASQNSLRNINDEEPSLRLKYKNLKNQNERLRLLRERIEKALQLYYDDDEFEVNDENNMRDKLEKAKVSGEQIVDDVLKFAEKALSEVPSKRNSSDHSDSTKIL